jgi:hypothetical protein
LNHRNTVSRIFSCRFKPQPCPLLCRLEQVTGVEEERKRSLTSTSSDFADMEELQKKLRFYGKLFRLVSLLKRQLTVHCYRKKIRILDFFYLGLKLNEKGEGFIHLEYLFEEFAECIFFCLACKFFLPRPK